MYIVGYSNHPKVHYFGPFTLPIALAFKYLLDYEQPNAWIKELNQPNQYPITEMSFT
jgi:hypothetical protein